MRLSEGVEAAVHVCSVLAFVPDDAPGVPVAALAEFHGVGPAYLAKTMQALVRAGICRSEPGRRGGFHLARSAADITLLDIVVAVDGEETAFRCTEIRQRGPAAVEPECYRAPCGIARAFWSAEDAYRRSLAAVSIVDIGEELLTSVDPRQLEKGAEWLAAVVIR